MQRVPELGYARSASEFYHQANYPFVSPRKLGPVVEVESPEAAAAVQEMYPWDRPLFVRSALEGTRLTEEVDSHLLAGLSMGLGIGLGIVGFHNRNTLLGALAMSTSGSLMAISVLFLVRELGMGK